jgi:N-acetylmuramoyl-L-alanine amidase
MSRNVWTAAAAVASFCIFGAISATAPVTSAGAAEIPADQNAGLLPVSVIDAAQAEGQTPAYPTLAIPVATTSFVPAAARPAGSLAALVSQHASAQPAGREAECLAVATYFEAKSESLDGQLAVAQVVLNRTKSGRFPSSICSVVKQPGQFSFVRGGGFPPIARGGSQWKNAVAISHIAQNQLWDSSVSNALFFHAKRVSPSWNMKRVASLGNHVFYR